MRKYLKILIITSIVIIVPIIAGVVLWDRLPEQIPTHFNAQGVADDYSSKPFAVFGIALFVLAIHFVCFFGTMADPRKNAHNQKVLGLVLWICPIVSLLCGFVMYGSALGYSINVSFVMMLFMGVVFVIIGNFLPKCRRNYTIGVKLPWTMNSDENWNRTHRFAGVLWIFGGLVIVVSSFFKASIWIFMGVIVIAAIVPAIYSFVYYLKHEKN